MVVCLFFFSLIIMAVTPMSRLLFILGILLIFKVLVGTTSDKISNGVLFSDLGKLRFSNHFHSLLLTFNTSAFTHELDVMKKSLVSINTLSKPK